MDSHDVGVLRGAIRRTEIVRAVLALGTLALVLAAAAAARDPKTSEKALVPPDRIGVVVLDLSLSITDDDYGRIRNTLKRLVEEDASIGLVVFSDVPYELLPPGTPAEELTPFIRLLVAPKLGPIQNPWTQTFRAGTRISVALQLARSMLERDEVDAGSILLVSDLETAPDDVPAVTRTIAELDRADIALRVVPLAPSSDALSLYEGLLRKDAIAGFTSRSPDGPVAEATSTGVETPVLLLALGALLFVLLAAHERFAGRIALPRVERAAEEAA